MEAKKAVRAHERNMHPGKTPTFKAGGPTSMDMKRMGRNMARAANQKSSGKRGR